MINYSFIIPHKNTPELLKRCVNSIPERKDIQIIVVDDNSDKDKKPNLQREGLEIVLLDNVQSNGAGHARNVGLEHAKGQWLLFADSDDYYKEGFLKILDHYKDSEIDVLYYSYEYRDGITGKLLPDLPYKDFYVSYDGTPNSIAQIKYRVKVPWNKMVSRKFVVKKHIQFEESLNGNDIFFSLCVGYYSNNNYVDKEPVYVYLKNENSLVNSKKKETHIYICKIRHKFQLNHFYDFIGHSEWKSPVAHFIGSCVRVCGFSLLIALIKNAKDISSSKNDWVRFFKKTQL